MINARTTARFPTRLVPRGREDDEQPERQDRPLLLTLMAAPPSACGPEDAEGNAMTIATAITIADMTTCWASRTGIPFGPDQFAGSVNHAQSPITATSPIGPRGGHPFNDLKNELQHHCQQTRDGGGHDLGMPEVLEETGIDHRPVPAVSHQRP